MAQQASSRPIWSGAISFGLVTIPVRLFTAVREHRLHFRTLHDQDNVPLKQKMVCPADGKEVHPEHTVKGYEIEKDRFVVIRQSELEAAAPKATKSIEIHDFVELDEIDPLFFDRPYHVVPKPEGAKPYKLLTEAMEKAGKVGIAKVVMFGKEYLAAIRPLDDGLMLETMHFDDEVIPTKAVAGREVRAKVDDREMKIAAQLIDSLTTKFDPTKYHDEYREEVMKIIEQKAAGEEIVNKPADEEQPAAGRGASLMAALEASLARTRSAAGGSIHGNGKSPSRSRASSQAARRRKSA